MTALSLRNDPGAPIGVDGFFQPRRAAFWLYLMFIANGLFSIFSQAHLAYSLVPTAVVFAVLVWTLYLLPALLFLRSLDVFEQHPLLGFAMAFVWGGFAASYLAIPINSAIGSLAAKLGSPEFSAKWGAALAGPTSEETLKYLGIIVLVLIARTQFRTILSVVVIGAMVGLGFQVVEDFIYSVNTAIQFPIDNQFAPVGLMLLIRGVVTGIWSHALYTSISAFGLGYFLVRKDKPMLQRIGVAALFFALAWSMHFFWNSPFLTDLGSGVGGMVLQSLLKGLPILLLGYLLWSRAGDEEGDRLHTLADYYLDDTLITTRERDDLGSLRARRAARGELKKAKGRRAARRLHALQRAQLHLLMICGQEGASPRAVQAAAEVHTARADLQAV